MNHRRKKNTATPTQVFGVGLRNAFSIVDAISLRREPTSPPEPLATLPYSLSPCGMSIFGNRNAYYSGSSASPIIQSALVTIR